MNNNLSVPSDLESVDMLKAENLFDLSFYAHKEIFEGTHYAWEALTRISDYLKTHLKPALHNKAVGSVYIDNMVFIGKGTTVEDGAFIKGPAIIGENCEIRHGAYIRGNVIIGDNCVLGNSSEFKNSILLNNVQAPHYNYVGDSILGNKSHLGAGVICSNLKIAPGTVMIHHEGQNIDTGLRKFGVILGDEAEAGCNTVFNPGSVIGKKSLLYPGTQWRGVLPPGTIVKVTQQQQVVERRF
ncbi:MAG: UDP-N-acetylglucosamine diphosphorylase [Verrucomicrobiota bacterium]|nr:UDP-N-acetylglucosamine diphosphorylase [Verrucomicrobiota bacterium]